MQGAYLSVRASVWMNKNHDIGEQGDDYFRLFEEVLSRRAKQASRRSG